VRLFSRDGEERPLSTDGRGGARARLEVRLLGEATVKLDGNRLAGFDSPRLQRLLAQLSLDEGGRDRARLAFELWTDSTESQARANLRKLLHDLRRALPDAERLVEMGHQSIRWRTGAPVSVDLVEVRAALARGDLAGAAQHYGGDLLPACYDDWVIAERERLRAQAVDVLLRLGKEASSSGGDDSAAAFARRALAIDSVCEPAYRLLMLAKARSGDRAEALRAYHRCVEVLDRELGVEPHDATRAAYESLHAPTPSTAQAPGLSAVVPPSSPLVGRAAEYEAVLAVWEATAQGRAHLLLVTGEVGIGKTRLVEELARAVGAQGVPVARTRSYQAAGRPPWGPVVDWIRSGALRTNLDRLEPVWLTEVARLLPELRTTRPDLPPPAPVSEAARHHLFDALSRALTAGDRPLLLVIDDLQWCDAETVEMIGFLIRAVPAAPVLVAGTVRADEVDGSHPATGLRLGLARDGAVTEVALGRLDPTATADLAAGLIGRSLESSAADRLWRETEGHPLFVVEAARTGMPTGGRTSLSPTVHAVISARLAQLSPAARDLVEVAATVGRSFTVEVLAAACGAKADDLADALDELWQRQIVRELGPGYDFTHDRIREVVDDLTPPARRRRLHAAVAGALAQTHRDDPGVVSALLARHYELAGMLREAVVAHAGAGQRSVEVFALEDAIGAFRHALVLLERLPADRWRDGRELELRVAMAVPLVAREGYGSDAVRDAYERALAICHRLGRDADPPVLRGLGLASLMACRFDRASQLGDALLVHDGVRNPTAGTEGHYLLGVSAFWRGNLTGAIGHLLAAVDAFRDENSDEHLALYGQDPKAVCTVRLALAELWSGHPGVSRALAADALKRALSLDHPTTTGYVRLYTAMLEAERDQPAALAEEVAAGEAIWSGQRLGYFMTVGRLLRNWLGVLTGEQSATGELADAVAGWRHRAQTLHFTYGLLLLTRARLRAGEAEAGRVSAAEAIRWSTALDQGYLEAELRRLDGELLVLAGERSAGLDAFGHSLDLARSQGSRWFELKTACSLACHDPGPRTQALLERALATLDQGWELPLLGEARSLLAGG
jgi:DNA-binding SARP family transcriptional activator